MVVADGGYATRVAVAIARAAQANLVTRVHLASFPLEQADGRSFDALAWLRQPGAPQRSVTVWCTATRRTAEGLVVTRHQVRVLAHRLEPAARAAAERRLRRNASKHQRQVGERGLFLAGWVLVLTTVDAETWPDDQVWALYRTRWHIELLFKRFKQLLRTHTIRSQTAASATATICALLIAWVLQEQLAGTLVTALVRDEPHDPSHDTPHQAVSVWALQALTLQTLRHIVCGTGRSTSWKGGLPGCGGLWCITAVVRPRPPPS